MTLLDEFFSAYDVRERHALRIAASPARVYQALRTADLAEDTATRLLFALRGLPAYLQALCRGRVPRLHRGALRLADLERAGFAVLAERGDEELLIGLQGRFWRPRGDLEILDAATARRPIPPGRARAGWTFQLRPLSDGRTELVTETRVRCGDGPTRRRFRWYWALIRPGSGLIRRAMLASIQRQAESAVSPRSAPSAVAGVAPDSSP